MRIQFAGLSDVETIHRLAHNIWPQTYKSILPREQIELMLDNMYSSDALIQQFNEGNEFILLKDGEVAKGFASYTLKLDQKVVFINKLYILPQEQGKGYGKNLVDFIANQALKKGIRQLELNVNRNNPALQFYLNTGFSIKESVDIPYYGYILNDYVMTLDLNRKQSPGN